MLTLAAAAAPPAMATLLERAGWEEIGRYAPAAPSELEIAGNVAYMGNGSRLEAIDLSDPAQPRLLAQLDLPSAVGDLVVRDGYVYVAVRNSGLAIVDARRAGRLKLVGWAPNNIPGWLEKWIRIDIAGDTAYCTGTDLTMIDISDPARPRVVGRIERISAHDVAVAGDRLYVACIDAVHIYDISVLQEPALLTRIDMYNFSMAWRIQVHDGRAYLMDGGCLVIWSLDGPLIPETYLVGGGLGGAGGVAFHGATTYVAGGGLVRIGIFNDWWEWYDWGDYSSGPTSDVAITGDLMVAVVDNGLVTYSLAGSEPQRVGFYAAGTGFDDVAVADGRAWLATSYGGLRIVDVTNPRHPRLLGELANTDERRFASGLRPGNISVCGQHALLYSQYVGLRVVDGTDAAAPRLVFSARKSPDGRSIEIPEAIAVADGWLVGCKLRGPSSAVSAVLGLRLDAAGSVTLTELAWPADIPILHMRSDGRHCYAIDPTAGLIVFDASAAGFVRRLGSVNHDWTQVTNVAFDHDFAYVAQREWPTRAIDVVDVADPAAPRWLGTTGPLDPLQAMPSEHLGASDGIVLGVSELGYVGLVDATRPETPVAIAPSFEPGAPWSLAVADGMAFLGSYTDGLRILRIRHAAAAPLAPAQVAGLSVAPNPCNPRATITFTMADAGPATVRVFDARGRLVRSLHDGWLDSGRQDLPWSGDDDAGRPAASGVYLVQAKAEGRTETARVTVVR